MAGLRFFNRKTGQFYIKQPKLIHVGPITIGNNDNKPLSLGEKKKIKEFADFAEYMGVEFGADTVISTSKHDIFKIRDEINNSNIDINIKEKEIKKEIKEEIKEVKREVSSIETIRKQLGIK